MHWVLAALAQVVEDQFQATALPRIVASTALLAGTALSHPLHRAIITPSMRVGGIAATQALVESTLPLQALI